MPRPKRPAAAPAVAQPAVAPSPAKGEGVRFTERDDEPTRRRVIDVSYPVNGETVVDRGFFTQEAAEAHADMIRKAYGL